MDICDICKAIKLEALPHEETPAFPHQPSLRALEASAKHCDHCSAIFDAVREIAALVHNDRTGEADNPYGGVSYFCNPKTGEYNYCRYGGYHDLDGGPFFSGPMSYKGPVLMDPFSVFDNAEKLRPWLFGNWWKPVAGKREQLVGLGVRIGSGPLAEEAAGNSAKMVKLRGSSLRFRTPFDSPLASFIPGRLRATDSGSRVAMDRARKWKNDCRKNHSCMKQDRNNLPTRVLDVSKARWGIIKLVETCRGQMDRYVALSHCWGLSHRIKTTKTTLRSHKNGINLRLLPQTFQDAVECTMELGRRWLWIDTLCIVQDDEDDWAQESVQMAAIYANAYVTLSAAASTDDSSGIFPDVEDRMGKIPYLSSDGHCHGRPEIWNVVPDCDSSGPDNRHISLCLSSKTAFRNYEMPDGAKALFFLSPEWMPSSTKSFMLTYQIGRFGRCYDPVHNQPLSTRAWTLQERLVAPRILHYGLDQMYWECREAILAEDGGVFPPQSRRLPMIEDIPIRTGLDAPLRVDVSIGTVTIPVSTSVSQSSITASLVPLLQNISLETDKLHDQSLATASIVPKDVASDKSDPQHPLSRAIIQALPSRNLGGQTYEDIRGRWTDFWTKLVEEYSARALTQAEDKLVAISSLAHAVGAASDDRYLAGLWQSMLPETLAWRITVSESDHFCRDRAHDALLPPSRKAPVAYPKLYRAPSWSWAAVDGAVQFRFDRFTDIVAVVADFLIEAATRDKFSIISGGWIKIRAPLLSVSKITETDTYRSKKFPFHDRVLLHGNGPKPVGAGKAYFDQESLYPCHALVLSPGTAILLHEERMAGKYVRIGLADLGCVDGLGKARKGHTTGLGYAEMYSHIEELEKETGALYNWKDVTII